MRMVVQASLPGCPPELCADAQNLSVTVQARIPAAEMQRLGGLDELCPACQTAVPLLNITNAVCPNGHTWGELCISRGESNTDRSRWYSSMYSHFFHLVDTNGADLCRLQSQSVSSPVSEVFHNTKLVALGRTKLDCRRTSRGSQPMSFLWESFCEHPVGVWPFVSGLVNPEASSISVETHCLVVFEAIISKAERVLRY